MYFLFAGEHYYPLGGIDDFFGAYGTLEDAMAARHGREWAHIAVFEDGAFKRVKSGWVEYKGLHGNEFHWSEN